MLTTFPVSPGTQQGLGAKDGRAPQAGNGESFWVDLLNPTEDEIAYVNRTWNLRVPSRGALEEIETSSRLRAVGGVLYLSMPLGLHSIPENEVPTPVGFVLSKTILVTIRFAGMHSVEHVVKRIERDGDIAHELRRVPRAHRGDGRCRRRHARKTRRRAARNLA